MSDVTQILNAIEQGYSKAAAELLPLVYEELRILAANKKLEKANQESQKSMKIKLNPQQRTIVRQAILNEAKRIGHKIEALSVSAYHVHLVARSFKETIEIIVSRYKNISMFALSKQVNNGRIWTRSFDKRFCFDEDSLNQRIEYVNKH